MPEKFFSSPKTRLWRYGVVWCAVLASWAGAQVATPENPVFLDDSPEAGDVLQSIDALASRGSAAEAIRNLQALLDTQPQRVLPSAADPDLYLSVREQVHRALLDKPALLATYRELEEPQAARLLEDGRLDELVSSRFLTASGCEGALRLAQRRIEHAQFESAALVLMSITTHPDFAGVRDDVGALTVLLSRYIWHDGVASLAQRVGVGPSSDRVEWPQRLQVEISGPSHPDSASEYLGMVPRPLATARLSINEPKPTPPVPGRSTPESSKTSWSLATRADDAIYTNDGDTISAWDRFTLRPLWRVERSPSRDDNELFGPTDPRRRQPQRVEDTSEVAIDGDRLFAATGIAINGYRHGDARLHCLDRSTGTLLWSVDVAALDPALTDASVRGAPVVVDQTVVVAVRKAARDRRIISLYLVGLDRSDGSLAWLRLVGSAGALPFQQGSRYPDRLASWRGIVLRLDEIGMVSAIEAATGNVLWIRRFGAFRLYDSDIRPAWSSSGPIIADNRVLTLTPDRNRIVTLDALSGGLLDSVEASTLNSPFSLLRSQDHLVALSIDRVAWVPLDRIGQAGAANVSASLVRPPMSGRPAIAGELVHIPRQDRITTIDLTTGSAADTPLDHAGNLLAIGGQIVAVDDSAIHSYMGWDVARDLLEQRLAADPQNASAAATLAELAFRAGRFEFIAPSVDRAIDAIERSRASQEETRASLFESILVMIDRTREPDERMTPIEDLGLLRELSARLERLANAPEELVAYHLVQAWILEASGEPARAVESLQSVLLNDAMSASFWNGGLLTIRADLEATRRLRDLLVRRGYEAYLGFDRESRIQRDLLPQPTSAAALDRLARQYPFSTITPLVWLERGVLADDETSLGSWQRGIQAIETLHALAAPFDEVVFAELLGRTMSALDRQSRSSERDALRVMAERLSPGIEPTIEGLVIALANRAKVDSPSARRADVGWRVVPDASPRLEQGRVLQPAIDDGSTGPVDRVLLVSPAAQTLRLMVIAEDGQLTQAWSVPAPHEPMLLGMSNSELLVAWLDPKGLLVERLDMQTGKAVWSAQPFEIGTNPGAARAIYGAFVTPLEGRVFDDQVLIAADDRMLALVERGGRIVTLERSTGQVLWSGQSPVGRVFDAAIRAGVLVVGGSAHQGNDQWNTAIVSLDARTGSIINQLNDPPGRLRWLRVTPDRSLIAGLDRAVLCVDLEATTVRWILEEDATAESLDAWVFDDRLLVLDQNRSLWLVDVASGRLQRPELETRGRLLDRLGIRARDVDGRLMFLSGSGALIFGASGELQGLDVFETLGTMIPSEPGARIFMMLDGSPVEDDEGLSSYPLHALSIDSARLLSSQPVRLHAPPENVTLLDGMVLISAGEATLVLRAGPEAD